MRKTPGPNAVARRFRARPRFALLAVVAGSLGLAPNLLAAVTEPNGMVAPLSGGGGGMYDLDALFMSRGEMIDSVADGLTKPAVFSPTCAFNGEMVLHGGFCSLDFGWYNVDPARLGPPPNNQIYTLIPFTSVAPNYPAIGSPIPPALTFNANNILVDPNYKGGLIGLAIKGSGTICSQTHFSEQDLNPQCSDCKAAAHWIMAVIWKSTKTPDSYYIGFEDLPIGTTAASATFDGDFNDFVYYVSGVSCAGGGAKCDTGMPGVCKDGLQECVSGGQLACKPVLKPTGEKCDGIDNDCNGMVDDGATCPGKQVCDRGVCQPPCSASEFPCSPGDTCVRGLCIEVACADKTCDVGKRCKEGVCTGPCDGVTCPMGQVCRVGRCVDSCENVMCASDRVCEGGVCVASCKCRSCDPAKACNMTTGACLDKGCEAKTCGQGQICSGGVCVDACVGAVCPKGQACITGKCVDVPAPDGGVGAGTAGAGGGGGQTGGGVGSGGMIGGGGVAGNSGRGIVDAASDVSSTNPGGHEKIAPGNGCSCDSASGPGAVGGGLAGSLVLSFVVFVAARRRRAR